MGLWIAYEDVGGRRPDNPIKVIVAADSRAEAIQKVRLEVEQLQATASEDQIRRLNTIGEGDLSEQPSDVWVEFLDGPE
jgi:hypothetical protein